MSKAWIHRLLIGCGAVAFITSAIVPVLAPILGPVGVKLTAIGGAAALLAGSVKTAIDKGDPPELFPPDAKK